ncbi:MAG: thioester reductase domain-containing protein [Cyanobacteriota bacterium]
MIETALNIDIFLLNLLTEYLEVEKNEIDLDLSFDSYGIDSISAIKITDKISKYIDFELEPSILYEYESIKFLLEYLNGIYSKKLLNKSNLIKKQIAEVTIASTFTAEPIEESISFCLKKLNLELDLSFSPYNQVIQELINPYSTLISNKGIKVILLRVEDWFRYETKKITFSEISDMAKQFIEYLKNATNTDNSSYILFLAPHVESDLIRLGVKNNIQDIDQMIISNLQDINNLYIINENIKSDYNLEKIFDKERDKIGHIPFTQEYFTALGLLISRKIFKINQILAKVLVIDCDNTLWKGVCGEEGFNVLPNITFQEFILKQKNEGKLLCLCSKNIESDVFDVFEKNPNMILKKEDFISYRINWESKSKNIISIAQELNLGLDSFIFIDDNELECAEVKSVINNINVINYPVNLDEQSITNYFKNNWLFDILKITKEDLKRTEMYKENKIREDFQNQFNNFESFLADLNLKIDINNLSIEDFYRAVQLTQKTNQFNATTIRLNENKMKDILADKNFQVYSVKVSDRFGDYGFVGLIITEKKQEIINIHTFLLSCRVLGKRVEHSMLKHILESNKNSTNSVQLNFIPTERNKPLVNFYQLFGNFTSENNIDYELLLSFEELEKLLVEIKNPENNKNIEISDLISFNSQKNNDDERLKFNNDSNLDYTIDYIAKLSNNINNFLNQIKEEKITRPNISVPFITPRSSLQKLLCNIFSDILKIDKIGIYDNFYDLGGDSLALTELSIKLWEIGLPDEVSLSSVEKPTVDLFSKIIEHPNNYQEFVNDTNLYSLDDDSKLSFDFDLTKQKIIIEKNPKHVLLTGVTGYVGAYLLFELLKNTKAIIYCHVRSKNNLEGFERVKKNLRNYDLWENSFEKRVEIIIGDLSKNNLGLSCKEYEILVEKIDTIYHNGACVNFIFPYNMLKPANVTGTEHIIKFAVDKKVKVLHFISTLGVLMSGKKRDATVFEDDELKDSEDLPNGYEQTKWVADKMVWRAMKKGLPVNIYRLGMLSGLGESGIYHKLSEFLPCFLKGSIQIGIFPDIATKIEMVPIDFVVKALVNISKNNEIFGKTYQMNHPDAMTAAGFSNFMNKYGYPVRLLPWDIWKNHLLKLGSELRNNALYPYVDFIKVLQEHQTYMPEMDMSNFLNSIKNTNLVCDNQNILLQKYFDYFVEQEYLPKPQ